MTTLRSAPPVLTLLTCSNHPIEKPHLGMQIVEINQTSYNAYLFLRGHHITDKKTNRLLSAF